jgi:outer membrane receptor protein involved in Fe transport
LATYVNDFTSNSGVPGTIPVQQAGVNAGAIPRWKVLATQSWSSSRVSFTLTERYFPNGVLNSNYIQCTSGCPLPTLARPTINNNVVKGRLYIDAGATVNVTKELVAYFKVDNITDRSPAPIPNTVPNNAGTNATLYDTLGRTFRVGLRGSF